MQEGRDLEPVALPADCTSTGKGGTHVQKTTRRFIDGKLTNLKHWYHDRCPSAWVIITMFIAVSRLWDSEHGTIVHCIGSGCGLGAAVKWPVPGRQKHHSLVAVIGQRLVVAETFEIVTEWLPFGFSAYHLQNAFRREEPFLGER
jgi:hypothetical protein